MQIPYSRSSTLQTGAMFAYEDCADELAMPLKEVPAASIEQ